MTIRITDPETALAYLDSINHHYALDAKGENVVVERVCGRCGGSGLFSHYHGVCYQCNGHSSRWTQLIEIKTYARSVKANKTAKARKDKEREEREQARQAAAEAGQRKWCEENGHGHITFAELDAKREEERVKEAANSSFVGKVGESIEIEGKVIVTKEILSQYGTSMLLMLKDAEGNKIKTFSSAKWIWSINTGDTLTIKATVKDHEEYRGEKNTVIKRPRLINKVEAV